MKFLMPTINHRSRFSLFIIGIFIPMTWFINHPLNLPSAPRYIATQMAKLAPQYQVSVDNAQLYWDRKAYRPVLLLQKILVQQKEELGISLENAAISFSIEGLLSFPPRPPIEIYLDNIKVDLDSIHKSYPAAATIPLDKPISIEESLVYMDKLQHLPVASIVLRDTTIKHDGHESQIHNIKLTPGKVTGLELSRTPEEQELDLKIDWRNKGQVLANGELYNKTKFNITADYTSNSMKFSASLDEIEARDLLKIWPNSLAKDTRSWLDTNLLSGSIAGAQLDIITAFEGTPEHLKVKTIKADIALKDVGMSYMEGAPKIEHLNAKLTIINDKIVINASNAELNGVSLIDLSAEITDIAGTNAELTLHSKINGSLMPIVEIALAHTKGHNFAPRDVKGTAEASVDLIIPLMASTPNKITIESKLTEVEANNIQKHSISKGDLLASYKDGAFTIKGKAVIDKIMPAQISYVIPYEQNSPARTEISETLTIKQLHELGFKPPSFLKKGISFKYINLEGSSGSQRFIEVDLSNNIDVTAPSLAILNLGQVKGKFKTEIVQALDGTTTLKDYSLKTDALSSEGHITLNKDYSISSINSHHTKFNNANFSFVYEEREDRDILTIKGNNFDISNLSLGKLIKKSGSSSKPFSLRSSLKKLGMYNGLVINTPELMVECSPTLCTSAVLRGKFDNGNSFNLNYKYPNLSWYSDNAGDSLRALNIYTKMKGGLLSATAKLAPEGGATKGVVDISNYHLVKTPILAKLLSVTAASSVSFGGLADIVKGNGIGFKQLKCPIIYAHNLLILDGCMQEGSVMNMTANGTLNLAADTMDVSGIVAPVNFINSLSRKVPILRQLSGGEKGGLIAMSYTMKGEFKNDPKIYVNPLSVLAPGFLKGIGGKK